MAAKTDGRVSGIDYLRAVFSVCVVAVHLGYISPSTIFDTTAYITHTFSWSDFVNFYVLCLAVPVFVLISTYLYSLKTPTAGGLWRRLGRITKLLVFWSVAYQIFFYTGYGFPKLIPREPARLVLYILSGGGTVYYFFVSLIVVTAVTHASRRLPLATLAMLFGVSTLTVGVLPLLHRSTGMIGLAMYANPLNFVPFAFAGVVLARLNAAGATRTIDRIAWCSLALAGATAVLDWTVYVDPCFFEVNLFALPAYTRPSLIFLGIAVVVCAICVNPPSNRVVSFMARHSLAVYCLHPFFVPVKYKMVDVLHLTGAAEVLVPLPVVIGLSYAGSLLLTLFLRDEVLR
jgi:surface polysaccharide O-acyltransferase-like enzyme